MAWPALRTKEGFLEDVTRRSDLDKGGVGIRRDPSRKSEAYMQELPQSKK